MPNMYPYPVILAAEFDGASQDDAINSMVLDRVIHEIVQPKNRDGTFSSGRTWSIRIEDQHAEEWEPHYILCFGEGDCNQEATDESSDELSVGYCDNISGSNGAILQKPGIFTVKASGDFGLFARSSVVKYVARIYIDALKKNLPSYAIVVDEAIIDITN